MKTKISISLEDELHEKLKKMLDDSMFRNKSHLIEYAIENLIKNRGKQ
ncbi:MAG: ribbon-helix-helix domain-containing protein [archaeon]